MSVELRLAPRRELYLWVMARRYGATEQQRVIVKDLSRTGFRIRSSADYTVGDLIFIEFEDGIEFEAWVVRQHPSLPDYGCQFRRALGQDDVTRIAAHARHSVKLDTAA